MKLLLDEMHAPVAAEQLRKEGHDVSSVEEEGVRSLSDPELLAFAESIDRAIVTENLADFRRIASEWAGSRREHAGIVYTHPARIPRRRPMYPRNLIRALRRFLEAPPSVTAARSWEWWLGSDG
jgi:predicted nuclease of predicted toxin-antitoxin system